MCLVLMLPSTSYLAAVVGLNQSGEHGVSVSLAIDKFFKGSQSLTYTVNRLNSWFLAASLET